MMMILKRRRALKGIIILTRDLVFIWQMIVQMMVIMEKHNIFTKALLPNEVENIYQQCPLGTSQ